MANTFSGKVWRFGGDITTDLVVPSYSNKMIGQVVKEQHRGL